MTYIPSNMFSYDNNLTDVNISDLTSLTEVRTYAFSGTSIGNITLPSTLQTIESRAFQNIPNMTKITIPGNVTSIGYFAFNGSTRLSNVCIKDKSSSDEFTLYDNSLFGWQTGKDDSYITWNCTD